MPRQPRLDPGQSALCMRRAHPAGAGVRLDLVIDVVGDVEDVLGLVLEALRAIPGHVLDHEESAVGDQDVVELEEGKASAGGFLDGCDTRNLPGRGR